MKRRPLEERGAAVKLDSRSREIGPTKWLHPWGHSVPPFAAVDLLFGPLLERPDRECPDGIIKV